MAATVALRVRAGERFRVDGMPARIRVAAATSSLPEVRDALEHLAMDEDEDVAIAAAARAVR